MSSLVPQIGETLGELRMMLLCILAVLVDRWMNNRLEGVTDECVALQEVVCLRRKEYKKCQTNVPQML